MINVPNKTKERIVANIKKFKPVITRALDKDINESDTVTIIADMLSDIFGYDKYSEITSEYAIKNKFCDLAIELDGKIIMLIEVKAIGLNLKDDHVRQAVDYGSNLGVEWVVLTNGVLWRVYKIIFAKPVNQELVYDFDITQIDPKKQIDLELIYYLCREAMTKNSKQTLSDYMDQKQILNRFTIAQLLLTDNLLDTLRKTLKKLSPDAKISNEEIKAILTDEIIKREALDGDKALEAKKKVRKLENAVRKPKQKTAAQNMN